MTRFVVPDGGTRFVICGGVLGASLLALGAASCADDQSSPVQQDDASILLDSAAIDSAAPPADAGCDAADPSCVTTQASCNDVDFCLVSTTVSSFYVLKAIWGTSATDIWAAGSGGTIVHWDGAAWSEAPSGIPNTFNAIWGSGADDIYIVSGNRAILHGTGTHGGPASGAVWSTIQAPLDPSSSSSINAVWGSSANDVRLGGSTFGYTDETLDYLNGDQFVHVAAADAGKDAGKDAGDAGDAGFWQPAVGTGLVYGIWGSSASDVWIVADNSQFVSFQTALTLHGTPGEAGPLEFAEVDSQSNDTLEAVTGTSATDVWAVGAGGAMRHFGAGDVRWQIVASPTKAELHAVWAASPTDVWAVGENGTILHYDGTNVTVADAQLPIGEKPALYGVWGSGPNDVWIVGDGVVLHYRGPKADAGGDR